MNGLLRNVFLCLEPPKNHMNENMRRIRRIMREKQSESKTQSRPMSAKDLWRSKQYDHVQSKVKQKVDEVSISNEQAT